MPDLSHFVPRTALLPLCLASLGGLAAPAEAVDIHDTRMLSQPALSAEHVAFAYAGDLWIARHDGSGVRRLTSHSGYEVRPRFSPDGARVAFSAEYDGNRDVYVVSAEGGEPRRLTWHPGADVAQGFTPDGAGVLFTSARSVYTRRYTQLFTVPVEGGHPEQLPIPHAFKAAYSPDGSKIAYVPLREAFRQWKNYRGGTASRIWLYDTADHSVQQIPQPPGRSNDTDPMWIGGHVYFLSDRAGEFNLFRFDPAAESIEQLTHHEDFPILAASDGAGRIVFEQAGSLHLFDPAAGTSRRLVIGVAADLEETRPRWAEASRHVRSAHISPSGARAVVEARGEIVTVPAEKGDPRNLTRTPGVNERSPAWSPDGASVAYFSDASGEYQLVVAPQGGAGEARSYALGGAGFYEDPEWSPDGAWISYTDNSWSLYLLEVASGAIRKVSQEVAYGPAKTLHHAWSPDSKWLAYTRNTENYFQKVHLYSLAEDASHEVTDGLSDVGEPVFDAGGKVLYFHASTDAGPLRHWFAMSNVDAVSTNALYLAVLPAGEPSPLARESDEEKIAEKGDDGEEPAKGKKGAGKKGAGKKGAGKEGAGKDEPDEAAENGDEPPTVVVDFERLHERILALPLPSAFYVNLVPGEEGQLYFIQAERRSGAFGSPDETELRLFDLDKREAKTLASGVTGFALSQDRKKVLVGLSGGGMAIGDAGAEIDTSSGALDLSAIQLRIDPRAEWRQIFHEAWRINRDYFYDPGMHGADWDAMHEKYAVFLPHLASREDLNDLIQWMCSELAVGHHRVFGGDRLRDVDEVPGGLLGADFEVHEGRYRFAEVFGGLNWNGELRSPLTEPGVEVSAGEYLLAVRGADLRPPENLYSRFENTAGKIVEISVGPNPDGTGLRTVQVVPVENEAALRNRDWVEGNLARVHEATDGRVAYVHVPDTTQLGHTYFKRYFFPQAGKDAIIIDERHNGGGQLADYYIDILRRPYLSSWAMRHGRDVDTPQGSIQGPKVMLIDETAGSGGDYLPWMFRELGLGTLVGRPTWGGLVGIFGFPLLMDGGFVTAPNIGIFTEDGFIVENVGVPPDVEVEQLPAEVIQGKDPQLEKAIEIVLEQLEAHPPVEHERPPFPIRVRR